MKHQDNFRAKDWCSDVASMWFLVFAFLVHCQFIYLSENNFMKNRRMKKNFNQFIGNRTFRILYFDRFDPASRQYKQIHMRLLCQFMLSIRFFFARHIANIKLRLHDNHLLFQWQSQKTIRNKYKNWWKSMWQQLLLLLPLLFEWILWVHNYLLIKRMWMPK